MAIQLARHAEAEVYATASAMKQDCVHECGTDLVFEQIISAPDPTQLGEACAQDICADQIFFVLR